MRVLVVGSGGREHALAWKLAASPALTKLWVAPGNPGTAAVAENVPVAAMDTAGLVAFARGNAVDLVVPGPEGPLVAGLADAMAAAGVRCVGPTAAAAQLEGSKAFTKGVCADAGIPTAMVFVRNPTGVSHSPDEHAEITDCLAGVEALADVLAELARSGAPA